MEWVFVVDEEQVVHRAAASEEKARKIAARLATLWRKKIEMFKMEKEASPLPLFCPLCGHEIPPANQMDHHHRSCKAAGMCPSCRHDFYVDYDLSINGAVAPDAFFNNEPPSWLVDDE